MSDNNVVGISYNDGRAFVQVCNLTEDLAWASPLAWDYAVVVQPEDAPKVVSSSQGRSGKVLNARVLEAAEQFLRTLEEEGGP